MAHQENQNVAAVEIAHAHDGLQQFRTARTEQPGNAEHLSPAKGERNR